MKIVLAVVLILILAALAYWGYRSYFFHHAVSQLPAVPESVEFTEEGIATRFTLSKELLLRQSPELVGTYTIQESEPSPIVEGERIVLAAGEDGTSVLGIVHADGSLTPVVSDLMPKADLVVTPSGMVVYSYIANPVVWSSSNTSASAEADATDDPSSEEFGSADGPVDLGVSYSGPAATNALYTVNLKTKAAEAPKVLGGARSPRLAADGSVRALTSDGVVRFDLAAGTRTVVLAQAGADTLGSGLSADGSMAALRAPGSPVIDIYRLSPKPERIGALMATAGANGLAFSDTHILVRTGEFAAAVYTIPSDPAVLLPPFVTLQIRTP